MRLILVKLALLIFLGLGTAYAIIHLTQAIDDLDLPDFSVPVGDPTPAPTPDDATTRAIEDFLRPMHDTYEPQGKPLPPSR